MNHRYTGSAHWDSVFMPLWRAPLVSPVLLLLLSGISLSVKRWTAWRSSWRPGFSQSEHRTTQWVRVCWTWRPGSVPSGIWLLWNWKNFISWCLWTKRTELESDSRAERWMMRCSGEIWSSQTWAAAATLRWPTSVYRVCVCVFQAAGHRCVGGSAEEGAAAVLQLHLSAAEEEDGRHFERDQGDLQELLCHHVVVTFSLNNMITSDLPSAVTVMLFFYSKKKIKIKKTFNTLKDEHSLTLLKTQ